MDIRFDFGTKHIGSGDLDLFLQVTRQMQIDSQRYQEAALLIRDGIVFSQSIDDFLDQQRNDTYINLYGKAAIVKAILEAEQKSKLYSDNIATFRPDNFTDTWFVKFMQMLGRGVSKENIRNIFDRVSFIVFNYDRCLEHFLLHALQQAYGIRRDEAEAILSGVRIIHPYGLVDKAVPFGTARTNYVQLADEIKTYTEQIDAADVIAQITAEIERAECVVFLGFAYHSQNMRLLRRPGDPLPMKPMIFGTACGLSNNDVLVVSNQFYDWFQTPGPRTGAAQLENKLTCAGLFDNYAKSLTGGD